MECADSGAAQRNARLHALRLRALGVHLDARDDAAGGSGGGASSAPAAPPTRRPGPAAPPAAAAAPQSSHWGEISESAIADTATHSAFLAVDAAQRAGPASAASGGEVQLAAMMEAAASISSGGSGGGCGGVDADVHRRLAARFARVVGAGAPMFSDDDGDVEAAAAGTEAAAAPDSYDAAYADEDALDELIAHYVRSAASASGGGGSGGGGSAGADVDEADDISPRVAALMRAEAERRLEERYFDADDGGDEGAAAGGDEDGGALADDGAGAPTRG